ncbi:MAG: ATP-dependent helicase HrpB [Gammaproteobacteria bacterium]
MITLPDLPVAASVDALRQALTDSGSAVLTAPPGSGKTTLVPLALMDEPWLQGRKIVMLEPRRLAARMAAQRIAHLLGEEPGARVGYRVRFEAKVSAATRIEILTEGILIRRLQGDPELSDVGLIIFDEVHERNIFTDLSLALALDVRASLRADLRLLAMSATLEAGPLTSLLGDGLTPAPHIHAPGRTFPVALRALPGVGSVSRPDLEAVASAVVHAAREDVGDLLVFLPGAREIGRVKALLDARWVNSVADSERWWIAILHGQIPLSDQDTVLRPVAGKRRVILSTNIAESSLTIEGVGVVIDSGLARAPVFDTASGLTRLRTIRISRAAAAQRAGRAGRLGPGVAYQLWTESEYGRMDAAIAPEIREGDLSGLMLDLSHWGVDHVEALSWLDVPPSANVAQAWDLLVSLEAVDEKHRITPFGRLMVDAPTHPRLARMLIGAVASKSPSTVALAADLAAIVEGRSPIRAVAGGGALSSDIEHRLHAVAQFRKAKGVHASVDRGACVVIDRTARALRTWAERINAKARRAISEDEVGIQPGVGALLSLAYPDRIARRRDGTDARRYVLANGRGARVFEDDPLGAAPFLVVANVDAGQADARIFLAGEIPLDAIMSAHGHRIHRVDEVRWDTRNQQVHAMSETRLGAIVLESIPLRNPPDDRIVEAMLEGVERLGLDALPWTDAARALQARAESLRQWVGEQGWPDLSDATLAGSHEQWLAPFLHGMSRRDHLRRLDLVTVLKTTLGWERGQRLNEGAPTHIEVPSGRHVPLIYDGVEPPVLAVRLQEMFGLTQTPTVAWGRVPVMVHLLSPAGRPVQVTQDLAGFWHRTYAQVKRELKGRYPKHYWPDDPFAATPTSRIRPR